MSKNWVAVASAEHARRGGTGGFIQVNHGKAAPLRRMAPGEGITVYAPTQSFGGKDKLQAFVLVGRIKAGDIYQGDMGAGFTPYRRDVDWAAGHDAPIAPLLDQLDFTRGKTNWGYQLRFGLFEITAADFELIAKSMKGAV